MNNLTMVRWAGGKGKQLKDLLPLLPLAHTYVEPFGGGASVLLNKQRSPVEVYNDLDHALVNLFEVVRDEDTYDAFAQRLEWTPYAREDFANAVRGHSDEDKDRVTRAVLFYTMLNQSISGKRLALPSEWSRSKTQNLSDRWVQRMAKLGAIHERLRGVQIESRDALDILQEWDGEDVVFYCDPPYILETRKKQKYYAVEPGDDYHVQLVDVLLEVDGMVILSGYEHPIYERLREHGWMTDVYGAITSMSTTAEEHNSTKGKRAEIVYRNPRAAEMGERRPLFIL